MSSGPCANVLLVAGLIPGWALAASEGPVAPVGCLIEPDAVVQLSTAVAGIVAEVMADRGDLVSEGQIIARLDSAVEQAALEVARARAGNLTRVASLEVRVAFLEAQAARAEQLSEKKAGSATSAEEAGMEAEMARQELAEARLSVTLGQLEVRQAEALLDQKTLRAPFDGVITEWLITPGAYRDGAAHIATIARLNPLRVEAFAPIAYAGRLEVGQRVTIHPEMPFDGAYPARITVIDRVFDAATATFGLRMTLPNDALSLPAGLRCEVEFGGPAAVVRD